MIEKKNKKRIILGACCAAFCAIAATGAVASELELPSAPIMQPGTELSGDVRTSGAWSGDEIRDSYEFLTAFTVPERTFTADGESAKADSVVIYPDGTATKNKQITLDQSGVYEVRYTAVVGGKTYYENVNFSVDKRPYYCTGSGESRVEYRSDFSTKFPYTWWNNDNTTETRYTDYKKPGLLVELKQGDKLECARLIDVGDLKKSDMLFAVTAVPYVSGVCDFERLDFVLTDSADPSISLKIRARGYLNDGDEFPYTYILAGGQNQALKGYEAGKKLIHVNDEWGTGTNHSFYGKYNCIYGTYNDADAHQTLKLYYDADENAVYTQWNGYRDRKQSRVIDLDDPEFFSDAWTGFPSGKARLTIEAGVYTGETARFLVSEIAGLDLSETEFKETEPPEITVDCDYETMPAAVKGGSYAVPEATAFDVYTGRCAVRTTVWYNYGQSNAAMVQQSGGKFVTAKSGTYAIVYEATDRSGNSAKKVLWVNCVKSLPDMTIKLSGDYKTACNAGESAELAQYSTDGGSGKVNVAVMASVGGSEQVVYGAFTPKKTGNYTITYTATDYIGRTATASYTLAVTASDKPIFAEKPLLPAGYISGTKYVVPTLYADDYASGEAKRVAATVKVTDGNGEKTYNAGERFTPIAPTNETLTLEFIAGGASVVYTVPCVNTKNEKRMLAAEKFFLPENASVSKDDNGVTITANDESGKVTFINDVLAESFDLEFAIVKSAPEFNRLTVTLTDSLDSSIAATVALVRDNEYTRVITSGGEARVRNFGFGNPDKTSSLTYSGGAFALGGNVSKVTATDGGAAFGGFPSGKVRAVIAISEAENGSAVNVSALSGQTLSAKTALDFVAPMIEIESGYGGSHAVGSTLTLKKSYYGDVLDTNATATMTVTDPDGNAVTDVDGKALNAVEPDAYVITLDKTGVYTVKYTAKDASGNTANRTYSIKSEDVTAPVLAVKGEWKDAKLGEDYLLPEITATDESGEVTVRIMILDSNGTVTMLNGDVKAIKFAVSGKHTITIVARDQSGNTVSERVTITVNE